MLLLALTIRYKAKKAFNISSLYDENHTLKGKLFDTEHNLSKLEKELKQAKSIIEKIEKEKNERKGLFKSKFVLNTHNHGIRFEKEIDIEVEIIEIERTEDMSKIIIKDRDSIHSNYNSNQIKNVIYNSINNNYVKTDEISFLL